MNKTKVAMIGVGKLGQDCAEVMALHYDVIGYDLAPRTPTFPMKGTIQEAVADRDIIFIAAPTGHDPMYGGESPTSHLPNKDFDYTIVTGILNEVNKYVTKDQLVVLISTVLPGTVRNILEPCITNARFIYNPYLIAMGTTKWDMVNPEMVIIGTEDGSTTGDAQELIDFYKVFMENDPRYEIGTWDEAESIKIFYNTFISTKVALVNMIQDVAETNGNINVDVVTGALKRSTQRITGPSYMTAGMGDGGACHPRDNIALRYLAERLDLGYDLFDAIMKAREVQAERMALRCLKNGKNITIIGKAYKPNVPYLNGSGSMLVGHYIEKHGGNVKYYDVNTGDTDPLIQWTDVYLIGYWDEYVERFPFRGHATVIDPWRKITPDHHHGGIIHYGDTRPRSAAGLELLGHAEAHQLTSLSTIWPALKDNESRILILLAWPEIIFRQLNCICPPAEFYIDKIKTALGAGKTKIIFVCSGESMMNHLFRRVHLLVDSIPELSYSDVFYVTAAINGAEVYQNVAAKYGWNAGMNILSHNCFESVVNNYSHSVPNITDEYEIKLKDKKFVCLNKVHRGHRVYLLAKMFELGLVDKSFYSFQGQPDVNWPALCNSLLRQGASSRDISVCKQLSANTHLLPLTLNITKDRVNPVDLTAEDLSYHTNSYFSVVTETIFYGDGNNFIHRLMKYPCEKAFFFTEKTFRPIAFKHPFILLSIAHSLKELHKLGFKTFHPFIDESYDSIEDDDLRMDCIVNEIDRLCKFTDDQWLQFQYKLKPIIEFNFNIMRNRLPSDYTITKNIDKLLQA